MTEDERENIAAAEEKYDAELLGSEELSVMNEAVHADSFPEHNPRHSVTESDDDAVLKKLDSELTDIIMRTERLRDELPPVCGCSWDQYPAKSNSRSRIHTIRGMVAMQSMVEMMLIADDLSYSR